MKKTEIRESAPQSTQGPAAMLLELRLIRAELGELAGLREDVNALTLLLLKRQDREFGERLVPLAHGLLGSKSFTAAILHAATLTQGPVQAGALRELFQEYSIEGNIRSLGRLLARLEGVSLLGCRLVRDGQEGGVLAWRIVQVSLPKNPQV